MSNLPAIIKPGTFLGGIISSLKGMLFGVFAKIQKFLPPAIKIIAFTMTIYFLDAFLAPALSHLVVVRNTITFFLTNTGMIGPITIKFFYILLATYIYFILTKNALRFWFS